jgi:septal ring factor EnvC (AmiA/AmiB activator)
MLSARPMLCYPLLPLLKSPSPTPPFLESGLLQVIMKKHPYSIQFLATLLIAGMLATPVVGQTTAQERAANLRQQLADVETKQAELETRRQQLEEDLKPENIEKGLAGIGSTHPEELRDQRRRQLEIEKKGVQTRLDQLATSRTRLETGILQADAAAYHSSASADATGAETVTKQPTNAQPASVEPTAPRPARRRKRNKPRRVRRGD